MQTKNQISMKAYAGTLTCQQGQANILNKSKSKDYTHNTATQNIRYSTRHGRGLNTVTVNK
jgi:hypothetical protein